MRNPTKKQVQKVIDNFLKVLPAAKKLDKRRFMGSVDMADGRTDRSCGTPMCHAGWYLIARKKTGDGYTVGKHLMANDLGFDDGEDLKEWADGNPKIWGNFNGHSMFSYAFAFNYKDRLTLSAIIAHWKQVQKRLPK